MYSSEEGLVVLKAIAETTETKKQEGGSEYALQQEMMVVEEQELKCDSHKHLFDLSDVDKISDQIRLSIFRNQRFLYVSRSEFQAGFRSDICLSQIQINKAV